MTFSYKFDQEGVSLACYPITAKHMAAQTLHMISVLYGTLRQQFPDSAEAYLSAVTAELTREDSPLRDTENTMKGTTTIMMDEDAMQAWGK